MSILSSSLFNACQISGCYKIDMAIIYTLLTLSLGLIAKSVNSCAIVDAQQEHQGARCPVDLAGN